MTVALILAGIWFACGVVALVLIGVWVYREKVREGRDVARLESFVDLESIWRAS